MRAATWSSLIQWRCLQGPATTSCRPRPNSSRSFGLRRKFDDGLALCLNLHGERTKLEHELKEKKKVYEEAEQRRRADENGDARRRGLREGF